MASEASTLAEDSASRVVPVGSRLGLLTLVVGADLAMVAAVTSGDPSGLQYIMFFFAWILLGVATAWLLVARFRYQVPLGVSIGVLGTLTLSVAGPLVLGYSERLDMATLVLCPLLLFTMVRGSAGGGRRLEAGSPNV